jgi:hypothetical protein
MARFPVLLVLLCRFALMKAARFSLALLIASLLVTGCVHTVRLKAVDATTGQPLQGVRTVWRQDVADLLIGVRHRGPESLPASKDDGIIMVNTVREHWNNSFLFTRSGFATLYGVYGSHPVALAEHTNAITYPWRPFDLQDPTILVRPTNGFIVLRMWSL